MRRSSPWPEWGLKRTWPHPYGTQRRLSGADIKFNEVLFKEFILTSRKIVIFVTNNYGIHTGYDILKPHNFIWQSITELWLGLMSSNERAFQKSFQKFGFKKSFEIVSNVLKYLILKTNTVVQGRPIKMRAPILYLANRWMNSKMLLTSNRF